MYLKSACALMAIGVVVAMAPAASAKVVVYDFTNGAGPNHDVFSPADLIGTLPAKFLNETKAACNNVANSCTYDFVFQLAGLAPGDTSTVEVGAQAQINHHATAEPISFDMFSGTPGLVSSVANNTNPHWLGHSDNSVNGTPTSPVFLGMLGNGFYYVQITPAQVHVSGEASSGSIVETLVPEPGTWALMLAGFGGVGAALRRRTVTPAAISA